MVRIEPVGQTPHLCWLQSWCPCMLRPRFCIMANHDGKAAQVCNPLVSRLSPVLNLMGGHDGSVGIRHTPNVNTSSAFYCSLFRFHCAHALFQPCSPKHNPDPDLRHHTAGMFALVSSQLLPNGIQWSSTGHHVWSSTSSGLDDRIMLEAMQIGSWLGYVCLTVETDL